MTGQVEISVIVPLFNEEASIGSVWHDIVATLEQTGRSFEVLTVDDGSSDGTLDRIREIAHNDTRCKVIAFRRNFGQTAALLAGVDQASGGILVPIDGDGQNDPADIPRLLSKLEEGYDVVSGWRRTRRDPVLRRTLPSRIANWLVSRVSGIKLHDYGCTLKAYRSAILEDVRIYGEMHRFIPIYASWQGGRVTELPVQHHPRRQGKSKYSLNRTFKILLDLIVIRFLDRYSTKPIYFFGSAGLLSIFVAFASGLYAVWLKYGEGISFIETPLPLLVALLALTGMLCFLMGLLAEMIMRTYYESQGKPSYSIKETINI